MPYIVSVVVAWIGAALYCETVEAEPGCGDLPTGKPLQPAVYAAFCTQHRLALDVGPPDEDAPPCVLDAIGLARPSSGLDTAAYMRHERTVNELKEIYATARYLLFQATSASTDLMATEGVNGYVDSLDYAVYGLRAGLVKMAIAGAYQALDRVARLLDTCVGLGARPADCSFESIWHRGRERTLRPELGTLQSQHVFALYAIAQEMEPGGALPHLSKMRRDSAHRDVVPHAECLAKAAVVNGTYHVPYDVLVETAFALLKLARRALLHGVAFVDEWQRTTERAGTPIASRVWQPAYDHELMAGLLT